MHPSRIVSAIAIATALLAGAGANAETTTYGYDALGRLTNTNVAGGPANGVATAINYDPADNRASYTVTGVPTPTPTPAPTPAIASYSFEAPSVPGSFQYTPTVSGASFVDRSGVAANNSAFGFNPAPDGQQVGFLQSYQNTGGIITLNVTGLTVGQSYYFKFQSAQRPGFAVTPLQVSWQGANLGSYTPASASFQQFSSQGFTATSSSGQVTFAATPTSGETGQALDNVTIVAGVPAAPAATVPNASFETPALGAGFQYNPSVADQYFGGAAGVAGNGSAFAFDPAPSGTQVAFLQGDNAVVAINVSGLTVGANYVVRFSLGKRVYYPANTVYVSFQGNNLGVHTPAGQPFQQFTTATFIANATTGVLVFSGQTSGDSGTGIDAVSIAGP